jgi:hypothetical protein
MAREKSVRNASFAPHGINQHRTAKFIFTLWNSSLTPYLEGRGQTTIQDPELCPLRMQPSYQNSTPDILERDLFHASFNNPPEYIALSYAWGDLQGSKFSMFLTGRVFEVGEGLHQALHYLQSLLTIWVDAICIDKTNVRERNQQVKKMKSIYQKAVQVIVWLGEASLDSNFGLPFARTICQNKNNKSYLSKLE